MRTTGKFDIKNQEIFEGDRVLHAWGWFSWKDNGYTRYQIHTIRAVNAYPMLNGEMRNDVNDTVFLLGKSYNIWEGKQVQKLTDKEVKEIGIEDDVDFFFDDKNKAVVVTDQHFLGLSDEDWKKELEQRRKADYNLLFGWEGEL